MTRCSEYPCQGVEACSAACIGITGGGILASGVSGFIGKSASVEGGWDEKIDWAPGMVSHNSSRMDFLNTKEAPLNDRLRVEDPAYTQRYPPDDVGKPNDFVLQLFVSYCTHGEKKKK